MDQFLPQLRHLQKCPPGPIEPGTAAELWKKVPVVTFYKGIPGIFRIYPKVVFLILCLCLSTLF